MCRHQGADQSILAQGSECDNGTESWSWLPCLPHSDSSLAFNNTGPGPDNSTTTTAELADNNSQRGTGLV